jgi:tRNA-specific 2-thiouridylase
MAANPYQKTGDSHSSQKTAAGGQRVLLAWTGGAGSAAAAILLQEQGYSVEGVTFEYSEAFRSARPEFSCLVNRRNQAESVAQQLGIPIKTVACDNYFQQRVISPLQENSAQALRFETCSQCHSKFRLEVLFNEAMDRGIETIATGHFCRISSEPKLGTALWRAKDAAYDQSFLLSRARPKILRSLLTPLGHMKVADLEKLLEKKKLALAFPGSDNLFCHSQRGEIGFRYLEERCDWVGHPDRKAYAVTHDLKAMSEIKGGELPFYWGQRQGVEKIREEALARGFKGASKYVVTSVDCTKHFVFMGPPKSLQRKEMVLENVQWLVAPDLRKPRNFTIVSPFQKVERVRAEALMDNAIHLRVTEENDAFEIGPGEWVAVYDNDLCVGSGDAYGGN